ncbi:MAG: ABC transporter permease [Thermaerobacter sp.]|nr:ABC transporter permease [Bacillota bacterium]REJ35968.1 MAG: ABC transporter permease [Bacillota bacterium]
MLEELERNLRAVRARAYVRVVGTFRELSWVAFEIAMPLLSVGAYVFLYRALGAPERYIGYVLLGGAMTAYWLNVLWSMASQFYWEKQSGQLEIFFITPVSRMSILAGMAAGGMFMSTARALGTLVLGSWLFGVQYRMEGIWAGLGIFLLTLAALYGLGMVGASLFMMYGREAWHTANLLQEPIYLLSGFYFPVRALPRWLAAAAGIIPITLGLDAIRQVVFPGAVDGLLDPGLEAALLAVSCAAYFVLAHAALRKLEDLAKREGRLTLRWQ